MDTKAVKALTTLLVLAHLGSPGQRAIVCVCIVIASNSYFVAYLTKCRYDKKINIVTVKNFSRSLSIAACWPTVIDAMSLVALADMSDVEYDYH